MGPRAGPAGVSAYCLPQRTASGNSFSYEEKFIVHKIGSCATNGLNWF